MKTIFLGGSCDYVNYYDWRQEYLDNLSNLALFNPYVKKWDEAARINEAKHRLEDDYLLFVVSGPNVFSIAELVDESNKRPHTVFAVIDYEAIKETSFKEHAFKAIEKIIVDNGVKVFYNHKDCIAHLGTL